jgi:RNA polymerase sigma-70 factor (ECF subfamily)
MRYASNVDDAQDILQDGFIKVFQKLETFRWEGSLEGWIRRVFVFTSIEFLRKKNKKTTYELDKVDAVDSELNGFDKISMKELLALIQQLPDTYRTIVNLYMVEGYTHREIGEILDIKESTSKSQLVRAKGILQKEISALKN